jgi:hypothetical protein
MKVPIGIGDRAGTRCLESFTAWMRGKAGLFLLPMDTIQHGGAPRA